MADEAKLTIELKDTSGGQTAMPTPGGPAPTFAAGPSIPSFFNAGDMAGKGSVPHSAPQTVAPVAPQTSAPAPDIELPFDLSKSGPVGDPLSNVVKGILTADPTTKADELQKALGISADRANALLNQARGNNQQQADDAIPLSGTPPQGYSSTPAGQLPADGPLNYYFNTTPAQRETEQMFGDTDAARAREAQTALQQSSQASKAKAADREAANVQQPIEAELVPDIDPKVSQAASFVARAFARNAGVAASSVFGGQAGSAVNAASTLLGQAAAESSSLAPMLAAAAPYAAGAAVAVGIPIAITRTIMDQEQRVYSQIRDFSPDVALADARNEIRQLRADMESARRLGPEVADYEQTRSRISTRLQEARDSILEAPLKELTIVLKTLESGIKMQMDTLQAIGKGPIGDAARKIVGIRDDIWDRINEALNSYLGVKDEGVSSPDWFDHQPFLPLPAPFNGAEMENVEGATAEFGDIPGLRF